MSFINQDIMHRGVAALERIAAAVTRIADTIAPVDTPKASASPSAPAVTPGHPPPPKDLPQPIYVSPPAPLKPASFPSVDTPAVPVPAALDSLMQDMPATPAELAAQEAQTQQVKEITEFTRNVRLLMHEKPLPAGGHDIIMTPAVPSDVPEKFQGWQFIVSSEPSVKQRGVVYIVNLLKGGVLRDTTRVPISLGMNADTAVQNVARNMLNLAWVTAATLDTPAPSA